MASLEDMKKDMDNIFKKIDKKNISSSTKSDSLSDLVKDENIGDGDDDEEYGDEEEGGMRKKDVSKPKDDKNVKETVYKTNQIKQYFENELAKDLKKSQSISPQIMGKSEKQSYGDNAKRHVNESLNGILSGLTNNYLSRETRNEQFQLCEENEEKLKSCNINFLINKSNDKGINRSLSETNRQLQYLKKDYPVYFDQERQEMINKLGTDISLHEKDLKEANNRLVNTKLDPRILKNSLKQKNELENLIKIKNNQLLFLNIDNFGSFIKDDFPESKYINRKELFGGVKKPRKIFFGKVDIKAFKNYITSNVQRIGMFYKLKKKWGISKDELMERVVSDYETEVKGKNLSKKEKDKIKQEKLEQFKTYSHLVYDNLNNLKETPVGMDKFTLLSNAWNDMK